MCVCCGYQYSLKICCIKLNFSQISDCIIMTALLVDYMIVTFTCTLFQFQQVCDIHIFFNFIDSMTQYVEYLCFLFDQVRHSRQVGQPCVSRSEATSKLHQCSMCAYSTNRKDCLMRHIRTHTGEKPFSCSLCSYSGKAKDKLIRHLRTHSGEKPFLCPHCPCRFSSKGYLKNHVRVHTGEKPYACSMCPYSSTKKYSLVKHLKKHYRT